MVNRGYCRISLDTKSSGSIDKQKSQITGAVLAKGGDPDEIEWYVDESKSGAIQMRDRPDGARLWRDVGKGDVVYVSKLDRAARSVDDLLATVKHIEGAGAAVVFVGNDLDTSTPTGRLLFVILAAVAEFERELIAERRRESIIAARAEGRSIVGGAPFGFRSVENPDGRGLVIRPDPETGPLLREAIKRVISGEAQDTVRHALGLSKTGMHKILHNPRLAGMIPEGDGVVTVDGVPRIDSDAALLSLAEWRELRDYLAKPETKAWSKARGYGAALRCNVCDSRMYYAKDGRKPEYDTYVCRRDKHEPKVTSPTVTVARADDYLERTFLERYGDRPVVIVVAASSEDARLEAMSAAQIHMDEAQRRFTAAETDEEADEALEAQRAARKALRDAQAMPVETEFRAEYAGETVAERWERSTYAERCRMLTLVGKWTVNPGRLPLEQKIVLDTDDMLLELLTHAVGDHEGAPEGFLITEPGVG